MHHFSKTPEYSPGLLLWQTFTLWQRGIKAVLKPHGLSHAEFVLLASLLYMNEDTPNQQDLVHLSKLDKMTVSQALRKLEAKGYVIRSEDTDDTRAKQIVLTKAGKTSIIPAVSDVETYDDAFFGTLTHEEYQTLITSLHHLIKERP